MLARAKRAAHLHICFVRKVPVVSAYEFLFHFHLVTNETLGVLLDNHRLNHSPGITQVFITSNFNLPCYHTALLLVSFCLRVRNRPGAKHEKTIQHQLRIFYAARAERTPSE